MPGNMEAYGNIGQKDLSQILQELTSARIVGVDTETISLENKQMIGLAIAPNTDYAVWFPENSSVLYIALNILRNPTITKVFHNAKFDYDVLAPYGIDESNFEDTEILAYTLNLPQRLYNLSMHLGKVVELRFTEFAIAKGETMMDTWNKDPDFVLQKCCVDAKLTLWSWYELHSPGHAVPGAVYNIPESYYIDHDIVHILRHMEQVGVKLNQESVNEFYDELVDQTGYLRQLIQTKGCDPNSNMQVGVVLAQRGWKLPYTKTRKQLKVDEKTIRDIQDPLAQSVLIYREKAKLKSTYAFPLLGLERAYTHYNNTRVITGRLSSSDPINMQNIPGYFRVVFLADTNFFSYDASQIELRTIAYLAQDKIMMAAFRNGADIHKETMIRLGITDRRVAKVLNFAVAYLGEEETIIENAREANIRLSPQEATDFRNRYFQTYTGIRDYVYSQREQIIKYGYVTTLFGRVRKADPIRMANPHSREAVIRELFNMPVQGTAAEVVKKMMARAAKFDLRIQVHDEMVYDGSCPPPSMFTGLAPFDTPLKLSVGKSWGDLVEIKV